MLKLTVISTSDVTPYTAAILMTSLSFWLSGHVAPPPVQSTLDPVPIGLPLAPVPETSQNAAAAVCLQVN